MQRMEVQGADGRRTAEQEAMRDGGRARDHDAAEARRRAGRRRRPTDGRGREHPDELTRLGAAFADASRRELYRTAIESPEPLSAGELGAECGLHRTVARAHLEKLVEAGLLKASLRHSGRGGRPPRVYSASGAGAQLSLPPRRYDWLARGLLSVLPRVAADREALLAALAEAGEEEGRRVMAGSDGAAVAWLNDRGYRASLDSSGDERILEIGTCVVAELASVAPSLVCSYDQGLIRGLFNVSVEGMEELSSLAEGDVTCRLRLERRL